MDASCASSVAVYASYAAEARQWSSICGTSLATPLFAGIVALADQYAGHGHAHTLGPINQAIYTIAGRHEPGIVDIRTGNNTHTFNQGGRRQHTVKGFSAQPGYDLVTGVGTIDAAYFVPELAKLAGDPGLSLTSACRDRDAHRDEHHAGGSCSPRSPASLPSLAPSSSPMSDSTTLTAPMTIALVMMAVP